MTQSHNKSYENMTQSHIRLAQSPIFMTQSHIYDAKSYENMTQSHMGYDAKSYEI